jgi:hypothetical protein
MVNNKLIIILYCFFIICPRLEAQVIKYGSGDQIIDVCCEQVMGNKGNTLKIIISNKSKENVYIFLSYWEVDGLMKKTDVILGYPDDSYIVNRIFFFPKDQNFNNGIRTKGHKGDYPIFSKFPNVLKLCPEQNREIMIEFSKSIIKSLDMKKYRFSCTVSFTFEKEWKILENKIGEKIKNALLAINDDNIVIKIEKFREPNQCMNSNVEINSDYSGMIRRIFDNFVVGRCNLETDWIE